MSTPQTRLQLRRSERRDAQGLSGMFNTQEEPRASHLSEPVTYNGSRRRHPRKL